MTTPIQSAVGELVKKSADAAQLMVQIMDHPVITDEDIEYILDWRLDGDIRYRILALVKNPTLTTEQLATERLTGLLYNMFRGDGLFALNYYLSHPNMTTELLERFADKYIFGTKEDRDRLTQVDTPVAFLTSPVVSERIKKLAIRQLVKNCVHSNYRPTDVLSGKTNQKDPTVLLRTPPMLTTEQIDDLYRRFVKAKASPAYISALIMNPASPASIRMPYLKKGRSRRYLASICSNPHLTEEELDIIEERFFSSEDFRETVLGDLIGNPSITFLDRVYEFCTMYPSALTGYVPHRVVEILVSNPALPAEIFREHLHTCSVDYLEGYPERIFHDPRADDDLRAHLLSVYRNAGKVPPASWTEDYTTDDIVEMFRDTIASGRVNLAKSTEDMQVLELAVQDLEFDVREAVALNENTPVRLLTVLSQDGESEVRRATTHRLDLPVECQVELATDPSFSVRMSLAQNRGLPLEVALILVEDANWKVRSYLAENSTTPDEIFEALRKDPREEVRQKAENSQSTRKRDKKS